MPGRSMVGLVAVVGITLLVCAGCASSGGPSATVDLIEGGSLTGWRFETEAGDMPIAPTWQVHDGVLKCSGTPIGALLTRESYGDYVLTLEWRWPAGGPTGNAGALVHATTPGAIGPWPRSLEIQLQHQHAGDFWVIGTTIEPAEGGRRQDRRIVKIAQGLEKPLGQWNQLEVTCRGDEVIVKVNGQLANHGTNFSENQGAIGLQSEGRAYEFRQVRVRRLE